LDSATGKGFDTHSISSPIIGPKENSFCKWVFRREMLIFGSCLSGNPKWVTCIGTLLETDFGSLATHFRFRCPYKLFVGDCLRKEAHFLRAKEGIFSSGS
jgi:hypothetical protein